ncbi:hypothetical protein FHL15_001890 [Xylaria flabelliformis]|uniref:Uncharacterized protein n=1 Tax=Xylaria flabelliformis TaxID=2512241 RepID=A0A553IA67_9PEZI|nr:hypothetical protein FHL15_001890 [Xylaria flabelliformis]
MDVREGMKKQDDWFWNYAEAADCILFFIPFVWGAVDASRVAIRSVLEIAGLLAVQDPDNVFSVRSAR